MNSPRHSKAAPDGVSNGDFLLSSTHWGGINEWRLLEETPECGEVTLHGNRQNERVCANNYCGYRTNRDDNPQQ